MRALSALVAALAALAPMTAQAKADASAQRPDAAAPGRAVLTADRVFADPDLNGPAARGVRLSPDGGLVTYLQPKPEDQTALDLWAAPTSGDAAPRRLIDSASLAGGGAAQTEAEKARRERQRISEHGVVEYAWDEQGRRILVPVSGELYLVEVATGQITRRIARGPDGADAVDARLSPKGGFLSFVRDGALYVAPVDGGEARAVTPRGEGTVAYATAEFVAQEEFARDTGYWWSPDERHIAFTRTDEAAIPEVERVSIGTSAASLVRQRYPRVGGPNVDIALFIRDLGAGKDVKVDLGPDSDIYLLHADWSPDGAILYVQRQNRAQTRIDLLAVDPATGAARVVLSETQIPWIDPTIDFRPLKDGFLWVSARSGLYHLYRYDLQGRLLRDATPGKAFNLGSVDRQAGVVGIDEARGIAYVQASEGGALERHLYAADLNRSAPPRRLSREPGWWTVLVGKQANAFVGTWSNPTTPPSTALFGMDGGLRRFIVDNRLAPGHPYWPYAAGLQKPEFGQIDAEDGQKLDWALVKPHDFDPGRRYPVIVDVYGGPGRQKVRKAWRSPAERLWLEAGYLVFQLDNRGASGRGVRFEAPIHKALGGPELRDQMAGVRFLKSLPFVDGDRIGVTGSSYGGYMTLRLLTEPGSGVAAGAAHAAPSDWRLYDTHYTEHYMGRPQDDPAAYDAAAIAPRLKSLDRPLLYMHGMADDNVLFENALEIVSELQRSGRPFEMMLYPGERHGFSTPNLRKQQFLAIKAFFDRTLKGAPAATAAKP